MTDWKPSKHWDLKNIVIQTLCCMKCKSHLPGGRPMGGGLSMLPPCSMAMWCPWCPPGNWPSATAIEAAAAIAAGCCCCARSMAWFCAWFIIATAENSNAMSKTKFSRILNYLKICKIKNCHTCCIWDMLTRNWDHRPGSQHHGLGHGGQGHHSPRSHKSSRLVSWHERPSFFL